MKKVSENPSKNRALSPLTIITGLIIMGYLTANVMAVKLINIFGVTIFDAGTIIFPLTYFLGDVLTEIWGFQTAKRVIWLTFFCEIIFTLFVWIGVWLPYPLETAAQAEAYRQVFTFVPRITTASLLAFLCGELTNAWTMVKIKEWTKGKRLWVRTIGSSLFGYIIDTTIFVCIAFIGTVPTKDILSMIGIQIVVKLLIEAVAATPVAYILIGRLKKKMEYSEADN
jgi:queuosine precursor transporter